MSLLGSWLRGSSFDELEEALRRELEETKAEADTQASSQAMLFSMLFSRACISCVALPLDGLLRVCLVDVLCISFNHLWLVRVQGKSIHHHRGTLRSRSVARPRGHRARKLWCIPFPWENTEKGVHHKSRMGIHHRGL